MAWFSLITLLILCSKVSALKCEEDEEEEEETFLVTWSMSLLSGWTRTSLPR